MRHVSVIFSVNAALSPLSSRVCYYGFPMVVRYRCFSASVFSVIVVFFRVFETYLAFLSGFNLTMLTAVRDRFTVFF